MTAPAAPRAESTALARGLAVVIGLWLIAAGLLIGWNGPLVTGADLIAMPALCGAGTWLIARVRRTA